MKGTNYNGSSFANKGMCSSQGSRMVSVGETVAFHYEYYCSPDGNSGNSGANLLKADYLLQKEIVLEEYDNTESDRFGSGHYDRKKIVELPNIWKHKRESWQSHGGNHDNFLCVVLGTQELQLSIPFSKGSRIEEIRENPGKFLHVYKLDDADYRLVETASSFEEAIEKIKYESLKIKAAHGLANWRTGREIPVQYHKQDYYAPSAAVVGDGTSSRTWCTDTKGSWLKIMPCVPAGCHNVILFGYSGYICVPDRKGDQIPFLGLNFSHRCGNSQSYYEELIKETTIQKGWFFLDGEDLYEETVTAVSCNKGAEKASRALRFEEYSKTVTEKYGKEILKLALRKKGSVLEILKALTEVSAEIAISEMKKILELSSSGSTVLNLSNFVSTKIDTFKAAKVAEKAYAWAYLNDAFPGVKFSGYFDEAKTALKIYSESWNIEKKINNPTLGDYFSQKFEEIKNKLA